MGFIDANMMPILKEHKVRPFSGKLLLLGQADIHFSYDQLRSMAKIANVQLNREVAITKSYKPNFADKNYISGETLFKSIGFEKIHASEYGAFDGCDIVLDLNSENIPQELENKFDVIINHGTIEHVFHIPNCFKNIFNLLKVGGRIIHSAPSSNCLDHGFYSFSPTLFYDWYTQNNWQVNSIQVAQYTKQEDMQPAFFCDYAPGLFDRVSYGGLDNKLYATVSIFTKLADSMCTVIPTQRIYKDREPWRTSSEKGQPASIGSDFLGQLKARGSSGLLNEQAIGIYLFGVGKGGQVTLRQLRKYQDDGDIRLDIKGFIDNNSAVAGTKVEDLSVYLPHQVSFEDADFVIVASYDHLRAMESQLVAMGVKDEKIIFPELWLKELLYQ